MGREKRSLAMAIAPVAVATCTAAVVALSISNSVVFAMDHHSRVVRRRRYRRRVRPLRHESASRAEALRQILLQQLDAIYPTVGEFSNPRVHLWALDPAKFSPHLFKVNFRVQQSNFAALATALKIPSHFTTENRSRFTGKEGLLIWLRRFSERGRDQTVAHFVGRARTDISRIVKHVSCWILRRWWGSLRFDPVRSTPARMRLFAQLLRSKGSPYRPIVGFLDGTRVKVSRPSHHGMQRAVYNAKYGHNLAYQLVQGVDGLSLDLFGPVYGSRHDSYEFQRSRAERILMNFLPDAHMVYSDSAYGRGPVVLSTPKDGCDFLEGLVGSCMNGKRVSVEWFFGGAGNRFPLVVDQQHNRFMQVAVAAQVASAIIVNNAINCLEPSQTSQYFGCLPPRLEEFLHDELPHTPADYVDGNGVCLATPIDVSLYTGAAHYLADVESRVDQSPSDPMI